MSRLSNALVDLSNYQVEIENICQALSIDSSYYIRTVVHKSLEQVSNPLSEMDINNDIEFMFEMEHDHSLRMYSRLVVGWIFKLLTAILPPAVNIHFLTVSHVFKQENLYGVTISMAA